MERYELHCHLDGSVRLSTLAEFGGRDVRARAVAPPDVGSLHGFLPYIDVALDVLQTPSALHRAAAELVDDWRRDGVVHGEVRFAPQLHTRAGLSLDEVIDAVSSGLAAASGVRTALLLCCLRHQDPSVSEAVADAAVRRADVAGLDLAGDERLPGAPHRRAFDLAHAAGLPVTVHAGEAAGPDSVWEALDVLGAHRIGHGVRSVESAALVDRLRRDSIALETCPRCNVLTRAVPRMASHPIDGLLRSGVRVTVSTDTRTTADTDLDAEFRALRETFGWGAEEERMCQENAAAAAFPPRGAAAQRPQLGRGAAAQRPQQPQ